jgi:hypothetical protein
LRFNKVQFSRRPGNGISAPENNDPKSLWAWALAPAHFATRCASPFPRGSIQGILVPTLPRMPDKRAAGQGTVKPKSRLWEDTT